MGRKITKTLSLISAGDMSLSSITSSSVTTTYMDNIGLIVEWSGTAPVGAITVQVQNGSSAWSTLDFGSTISVSGNSGNLNININETPFDNLRVVYTKTSGTGSITVTLAAKVVGA